MSKVQVLTNKNEITSLNKFYNLAKLLLMLTPFISFIYLTMEATSIGISMQELIQQDSNFTILLLVSMINPFIAYLLVFIQKKIEDNDVSYAITNLVMFMIAEVLLQNTLYIILFGVILYKTSKVYNISVKDSFKEKLKDKFLMNISGSLVVIGLACICLFATIRINM
ncbi:MAG: hypothetical protein U0L64_05345 [Clostridium sp.]|nr:hypothetical protein [Clostridium sp.]